MNAKGTICKYIAKPSRIALILLVFVCFFLVASLRVILPRMLNPPVPFDSHNPAEERDLYLDIASISNCLYKLDNTIDENPDVDYFYAVTDAAGNEYIICSSSRIKSKSLSRMIGSASDLMPLYKRLSSACDMDSAEFAQRYGSYYFSKDGRSSLIIPILLLSVIALIIPNRITVARNKKRCLKRLDQLGYTERAAQQLRSALADPKAGHVYDRAVLTQNFLFSSRKGIVLFTPDIQGISTKVTMDEDDNPQSYQLRFYSPFLELQGDSNAEFAQLEQAQQILRALMARHRDIRIDDTGKFLDPV